MEIRWTTSDGYVGERPHKLKVNDDELLDCGSVEEAASLIESAIQEDFGQKVSAAYDLDKIKAEVQRLFDSRPSPRATDDREDGEG